MKGGNNNIPNNFDAQINYHLNSGMIENKVHSLLQMKRTQEIFDYKGCFEFYTKEYKTLLLQGKLISYQSLLDYCEKNHMTLLFNKRDGCFMKEDIERIDIQEYKDYKVLYLMDNEYSTIVIQKKPFLSMWVQYIKGKVENVVNVGYAV